MSVPHILSEEPGAFEMPWRRKGEHAEMIIIIQYKGGKGGKPPFLKMEGYPTGQKRCNLNAGMGNL